MKTRKEIVDPYNEINAFKILYAYEIGILHAQN